MRMACPVDERGVVFAAHNEMVAFPVEGNVGRTVVWPAVSVHLLPNVVYTPLRYLKPS